MRQHVPSTQNSRWHLQALSQRCLQSLPARVDHKAVERVHDEMNHFCFPQSDKRSALALPGCKAAKAERVLSPLCPDRGLICQTRMLPWQRWTPVSLLQICLGRRTSGSPLRRVQALRLPQCRRELIHSGLAPGLLQPRAFNSETQ